MQNRVTSFCANDMAPAKDRTAISAALDCTQLPSRSVRGPVPGPSHSEAESDVTMGPVILRSVSPRLSIPHACQCAWLAANGQVRSGILLGQNLRPHVRVVNKEAWATSKVSTGLNLTALE